MTQRERDALENVCKVAAIYACLRDGITPELGAAIKQARMTSTRTSAPDDGGKPSPLSRT